MEREKKKTGDYLKGVSGVSQQGGKEYDEPSGSKAIPQEVIVFAEVVFVFLILLFVFRQRTPKEPIPVPTETPTPTMTNTPTPTPSPSPSPSPTPTCTPTPIPEGKAVEKGHPWKPFTGYWAYNAKGTAQHALQKVAKSTDNGLRVVTDPYGVDRYCVALGTYWAGGHPEHIGRCLDVYMVNGAVLHCVLADVKKEEDTKGGKNRYGKANNDFLEFIVDERYLPKEVHGDVSDVGSEFEGDAWQVVVFDYWIDGF